MERRRRRRRHHVHQCAVVTRAETPPPHEGREEGTPTDGEGVCVVVVVVLDAHVVVNETELGRTGRSTLDVYYLCRSRPPPLPTHNLWSMALEKRSMSAPTEDQIRTAREIVYNYLCSEATDSQGALDEGEVPSSLEAMFVAGGDWDMRNEYADPKRRGAFGKAMASIRRFEAKFAEHPKAFEPEWLWGGGEGDVMDVDSSADDSEQKRIEATDHMIRTLRRAIYKRLKRKLERRGSNVPPLKEVFIQGGEWDPKTATPDNKHTVRKAIDSAAKKYDCGDALNHEDFKRKWLWSRTEGGVEMWDRDLDDITKFLQKFDTSAWRATDGGGGAAVGGSDDEAPGGTANGSGGHKNTSAQKGKAVGGAAGGMEDDDDDELMPPTTGVEPKPWSGLAPVDKLNLKCAVFERVWQDVKGLLEFDINHLSIDQLWNDHMQDLDPRLLEDDGKRELVCSAIQAIVGRNTSPLHRYAIHYLWGPTDAPPVAIPVGYEEMFEVPGETKAPPSGVEAPKKPKKRTTSKPVVSVLKTETASKTWSTLSPDELKACKLVVYKHVRKAMEELTRFPTIGENPDIEALWSKHARKHDPRSQRKKLEDLEKVCKAVVVALGENSPLLQYAICYLWGPPEAPPRHEIPVEYTQLFELPPGVNYPTLPKKKKKPTKKPSAGGGAAAGGTGDDDDDDDDDSDVQVVVDGGAASGSGAPKRKTKQIPRAGGGAAAGDDDDEVVVDDDDDKVTSVREMVHERLSKSKPFTDGDGVPSVEDLFTTPIVSKLWDPRSPEVDTNRRNGICAVLKFVKSKLEEKGRRDLASLVRIDKLWGPVGMEEKKEKLLPRSIRDEFKELFVGSENAFTKPGHHAQPFVVPPAAYEPLKEFWRIEKERARDHWRGQRPNIGLLGSVMQNQEMTGQLEALQLLYLRTHRYKERVVVLSGNPGSGKTVVSMALAQALGCDSCTVVSTTTVLQSWLETRNRFLERDHIPVPEVHPINISAYLVPQRSSEDGKMQIADVRQFRDEVITKAVARGPRTLVVVDEYDILVPCAENTRYLASGKSRMLADLLIACRQVENLFVVLVSATPPTDPIQQQRFARIMQLVELVGTGTKNPHLKEWNEVQPDGDGDKLFQKSALCNIVKELGGQRKQILDHLKQDRDVMRTRDIADAAQKLSKSLGPQSWSAFTTFLLTARMGARICRNETAAMGVKLRVLQVAPETKEVRKRMLKVMKDVYHHGGSAGPRNEERHALAMLEAMKLFVVMTTINQRLTLSEPARICIGTRFPRMVDAIVRTTLLDDVKPITVVGVLADRAALGTTSDEYEVDAVKNVFGEVAGGYLAREISMRRQFLFDEDAVLMERMSNTRRMFQNHGGPQKMILICDLAFGGKGVDIDCQLTDERNVDPIPRTVYVMPSLGADVIAQFIGRFDRYRTVEPKDRNVVNLVLANVGSTRTITDTQLSSCGNAEQRFLANNEGFLRVMKDHARTLGDSNAISVFNVEIITKAEEEYVDINDRIRTEMLTASDDITPSEEMKQMTRGAQLSIAYYNKVVVQLKDPRNKKNETYAGLQELQAGIRAQLERMATELRERERQKMQENSMIVDLVLEEQLEQEIEEIKDVQQNLTEQLRSITRQMSDLEHQEEDDDVGATEEAAAARAAIRELEKGGHASTATMLIDDAGNAIIQEDNTIIRTTHDLEFVPFELANDSPSTNTDDQIISDLTGHESDLEVATTNFAFFWRNRNQFPLPEHVNIQHLFDHLFVKTTTNEIWENHRTLAKCAYAHPMYLFVQFTYEQVKPSSVGPSNIVYLPYAKTTTETQVRNLTLVGMFNERVVKYIMNPYYRNPTSPKCTPITRVVCNIHPFDFFQDYKTELKQTERITTNIKHVMSSAYYMIMRSLRAMRNKALQLTPPQVADRLRKVKVESTNSSQSQSDFDEVEPESTIPHDLVERFQRNCQRANAEMLVPSSASGDDDWARRTGEGAASGSGETSSMQLQTPQPTRPPPQKRPRADPNALMARMTGEESTSGSEDDDALPNPSRRAVPGRPQGNGTRGPKHTTTYFRAHARARDMYSY